MDFSSRMFGWQGARENSLTNEHNECLKSLDVTAYEWYRKMNLRRRVAGTGSWIFSNTNYKYWLENDNHPILWIHGGSGSGKTMLSTVLSKELLTSQHAPSSQECSVAYFFCDDKDDRLKTSYGLLTHVLAQLLKQNPNALTHFYNESALKIDKEKTVWTVEMLWRVLSRIVADEKLKPIYVIIDALDECKEDARTAFLCELRDHLHGNHANSIGKRIKIVIVSRPQIPMESYFPNVVVIPLESHNRGDIQDVVHARVDELKMRNFPDELRQEIEESLLDGPEGILVRTNLILYDLKTATKTSPFVVRKKMKEFPKSLPDMYRKLLHAIDLEDQETANSMLRWAVWAERPLTVNELRIAAAVHPGNRSMSAMAEIMELDLDSVIRSTLGVLIEIRDDMTYLVHGSAREVFKEFTATANAQFPLKSDEANLYIATSCLTYMSYDEFKNPKVPDDNEPHYDGLAHDSLYDYASSYWQNHLRQLSDIKALGNYSGYALFTAASQGHGDIVRLLVERGADVDALRSYYDNALRAAADGGHEDIVSYLVEQGADVTARGDNGNMELQYTGGMGNSKIVNYLLGKGMDLS